MPLEQPSSRRGRGRPKQDLAIRVRNWTWYWMVKSATGLGDDKLDENYANPDDKALVSRLRVFFRIRALGTSPDATQGYRTRESVYEIANRKSAALLAPAKQVFESEIWDFLQQPDRPAAEYTRFINLVCERRGWYRAPWSDRKLGVLFLGGDEPAFQTGLSPAYRAMLLHLIEAQPDLEALALLAALFREAYGSFQLDQAVAIRSALKTATSLYVGGSELPWEVGKVFEQLIWDRIVGNQIINNDPFNDVLPVVGDGQVAARSTIQSPAQAIKRFAQRYAAGQFREANPGPGQVPIVPRSARIDWLQDRKEVLSIGATLMKEAQQTSWNHGDSEDPPRPHAAEQPEMLLEDLQQICDLPPRVQADQLSVSGRVVVSSIDEMFGIDDS